MSNSCALLTCNLCYLQDIQTSLANNQVQYDSTDELSQRVLSNSSPLGQDRVRHEMSLLREEHDGVKTAVSESQTRLQVRRSTELGITIIHLST